MLRYSVHYRDKTGKQVEYFVSIGHALDYARKCAKKYGAFAVYDGHKLRLKKGRI